MLPPLMGALPPADQQVCCHDSQVRARGMRSLKATTVPRLQKTSCAISRENVRRTIDRPTVEAWEKVAVLQKLSKAEVVSASMLAKALQEGMEMRTR